MRRYSSDTTLDHFRHPLTRLRGFASNGRRGRGLSVLSSLSAKPYNMVLEGRALLYHRIPSVKHCLAGVACAHTHRRQLHPLRSPQLAESSLVVGASASSATR